MAEAAAKRCAHADVLVEVQHGWSWTLYQHGKPVFSGQDNRNNPRVFVACNDCGYLWRVTENALGRCPKWMRQAVQPALDEWWARAPSPIDSIGRTWFKAKGLT